VLLLEFYVNYDCAADSPLLVQKIIGSQFNKDNLVKIAQGKYRRTQFQVQIHAQQEFLLKCLALETLVQMMQGLRAFYLEAAAKGLAARERASVDESMQIESETVSEDAIEE